MGRKWIVGSLLFVVIAYFLAMGFTVIIWDGGYDLTVHVTSNPGPPWSVECQTFGRRDDAEFAIEIMGFETRSRTVVADPFDGSPLIATVRTSGRESSLGWEISRYQDRFLVVFATLPHDTRVGKIVEIPDVRVSRTVNVELP